LWSPIPFHWNLQRRRIWTSAAWRYCWRPLCSGITTTNHWPTCAHLPQHEVPMTLIPTQAIFRGLPHSDDLDSGVRERVAWLNSSTAASFAVAWSSSSLIDIATTGVTFTCALN
jgi:hypothetical protein